VLAAQLRAQWEKKQGIGMDNYLAQAILNFRSSRCMKLPDMQLEPIPTLAVFDSKSNKLVAQPGVMFVLTYLQPRSVGTVRLQSADPSDPPLIDSNLLADRRDLGDLIAGLRYSRQVFRTAPLTNFAGPELFP